jgi:hypothetical protein
MSSEIKQKQITGILINFDLEPHSGVTLIISNRHASMKIDLSDKERMATLFDGLAECLKANAGYLVTVESKMKIEFNRDVQKLIFTAMDSSHAAAISTTFQSEEERVLFIDYYKEMAVNIRLK